MEGGMPSMVEDSGVSDSQMVQVGGNGASDVSGGRNESNERQLAEKLEKSEAGRKKLRQAIALLKEKLEATSQALKVNEDLRQEVERERLNADMERKRAETEKNLREKVEKENLTIKEQFIGVLQRLDSLESSFKADRSEFDRIHSEVKEAVGGIGAALQAVEATKNLYQSLERSLHAKINGAVQSSSKALAIAQTGQATTSGAQAAALAAQSLAKTVQKEVQSVSSQVATLQKQASNLVVLEASLQQESQLRGPRTPLNSPESGEANVSLAVSKEKVSIDVSPGRSAPALQGTVPAKNQTEVQKSSQAKDDSCEGDMLNMLVASTEKSRGTSLSSSIGLPPRGGMFLSRNQLPDGGLKPQTTIPQVLLGAKSPRNGLLETVNRDEFSPNAPHCQPGLSSFKKGPVAIITGVDSILSPAVRVPASLDFATKASPSLYITSPSARATALPKQIEVQPPKFPNKRSLVKRSQGDPNVAGSDESCPVKVAQRNQNKAGRQKNTSAPGPTARNEACNALVVEDHDTFSEGIAQPIGKPYPNSTTKLLKSIMKMFEKEGKNRRSMEDKLMKLQEAVENHGGPGQVAQIGTKRKRETRKERGDGASEEKGKKRQRQGKEPKKLVIDFRLDDAVTFPNERPCNTANKCDLQEQGARQNVIQASEDGQSPQDRLSEMISMLQGRCRGEGLFENIVACQENREVPGVEECKDSSDVDVCNEDQSKEGTGTNTDLESTDDDLGEDWWAKKCCYHQFRVMISLPNWSNFRISAWYIHRLLTVKATRLQVQSRGVSSPEEADRFMGVKVYFFSRPGIQ